MQPQSGIVSVALQINSSVIRGAFGILPHLGGSGKSGSKSVELFSGDGRHDFDPAVHNFRHHPIHVHAGPALIDS